MLVDSHCHLDSTDLDNTDVLVARARDSGVGTILTIATSRANIEAVKNISDCYRDVWCSIGIHPHEAKNDYLSVQELVKLAEHSKVVGIGETGLDFFYNYSPKYNQEESFRVHCEVARQMHLPLIVHSRDADVDTIRILEDECSKGELRGVLHCFSASMELAEVCLELGFYISISGMVTFKKADLIRSVVEIIPNNRLLVETDAPYLSPVPKRGKRNESSYLIYTAIAVAEIRQRSFVDLCRMTTDNFFTLFSRCQRPKKPPNLPPDLTLLT